MLFAESEWPDWITLGGGTARGAAGSDWLAAANGVVCLLLTAGCVLMAGFWVREAVRGVTPAGKGMKWVFAALFGFGGFAAFGLPTLMTWWPLWSPLLAWRGSLAVLLFVGLGMLFFRRLRVHFVTPSDLAARLKAAAPAVRDATSPHLTPAEMRAQLESLCQDILRGDA